MAKQYITKTVIYTTANILYIENWNSESVSDMNLKVSGLYITAGDYDEKEVLKKWNDEMNRNVNGVKAFDVGHYTQVRKIDIATFTTYGKALFDNESRKNLITRTIKHIKYNVMRLDDNGNPVTEEIFDAYNRTEKQIIKEMYNGKAIIQKVDEFEMLYGMDLDTFDLYSEVDNSREAAF